ncbi:MAG TPA: cobalamin-binding protein [Desulfuromonadales bacterium]|nr:cobalamin-binding protein [Desulfuromonadales bacterium]
MIEDIRAQYVNAVYDTDRQQALQVVQEALGRGMSAEDVMFKVVVPAIEDMIASVEQRHTNLAQHFMASQIAAEVTDMMVPLFAKAPEYIGRIVIGTSVGDFHGLGKRIVSGCLKAQMIEVIDLGLNVSAEKFVDQALAHKAGVIGISSMMVHSARDENAARGVRKILKERNLEAHIRIIVGGAPYNYDEELYKVVQADAWAHDGTAAGPIIARLLREVQP